MKELASRYKWPPLAYDGSKQLFAPSGHEALKEAHRQDGVTYRVERPDDLPGDPGEEFLVRIKFAVPVRVRDAIDAHLRGDPGSELIPAAAFQALDDAGHQRNAPTAPRRRRRIYRQRTRATQVTRLLL